MRSYEPGEINIVWTLKPPYEANRFGIRHGIWKRLREASVSRELDNPELVKLVGAIVFGVVVEAKFRRAHHFVEIIGVGRQVIDLNVYVIPFVARDGVIPGDVTKEILNSR